MTVLAVDDVPENLDVIRGILVPAFRVQSVLSGAIALKLVEKTPPDIILLDIMMPDLDGYEVCRQLKENPKTQNIPVIFVTAMGEEVDELRGFALGAVDYIRKPISHAVLKARVGVHTDLKRAIRQLGIKNRLLQDEREMVERIVNKMRTDAHFNPLNLRYSMESLERTNGDVLFSALRPDGAQHILLGDFTGHGLKAAVGGPLAAAFFYIRTRDGLGGRDLFQEINAILNNQLPTGMFMAATLVEIAASRDRFRLWNAALPEQVLIVGAQKSHRLFPSSLPPMGLLDDIVVEEGEWVEWREEDRLFLFSDGLVELLNEGGEFLGSNGLAALLAQPGLMSEGLDEILDRARGFSEDGKQVDDMTLVECRR
ncbi:MAG: SpoIIE family protein phosphatase [Magnetococcales bacterium]|nr:SpoIIE family protein phosphatase [Magnetococcales bacterium]